MSKIANYYSEEAARIYDRERYPLGADVIAGLLHIHCKKALEDVRILDAGCGTGLYANALIELGVRHLTLLDASAEMLAVAREKLGDATKESSVTGFTQAILPDLPFADCEFDAIMFNSVLHHLDKGRNDGHFPRLEKTVVDAKRILRPKGVLIALVPAIALVKESEWFTQIHPESTDKLLQYLPTNKQYLDLFSKCGFQCVSEMNLLTGATPSLFNNYLDPEGPLNEAWRIGTSAFDLASEDEIREIENIIHNLKQNGTLRKFMIEHDRTAELGVAALFCFISI